MLYPLSYGELGASGGSRTHCDHFTKVAPRRSASLAYEPLTRFELVTSGLPYQRTSQCASTARNASSAGFEPAIPSSGG